MESDSHYPRWKKVHQNIEKYTVLNESIAKLTEGTLTKVPRRANAAGTRCPVDNNVAKTALGPFLRGKIT